MQEWSEDDLDSEGSQDEVAQLAVLRSNAQDALERIWREIMDDESFQELSTTGLKIREERLHRHFTQFENADVLYRRIKVDCTDALYNQLENEYMQALEKIRAQVNRGEACETAQHEHRLPQVIKIEAPQLPQLTKFN